MHQQEASLRVSGDQPLPLLFGNKLNLQFTHLYEAGLPLQGAVLRMFEARTLFQKFSYNTNVYLTLS